MKPSPLATRMRAIATGTAPTRRRHVLTAAQAEAVREVAVLVGRCLINDRVHGMRRGPRLDATERRPAPAELVGVLP